MKMHIDMELPESCGWYLEGCVGWFVACVTNILYKYDIQRKILYIVSYIPTENHGPYQNPFCMKSGDVIYCFPEFESSIWCYNLVSKEWREIELCEKTEPAMTFLLGEYRGECYFFSSTSAKLYALNLKSGMIQSYSMDVQVTCAYYIHGILSNGRIYLVIGGTSIYEFDLETCCQEVYDFPDLDDILFRIEAEGDKLWIIGKKKRVYVWERGDKKLKVLTDFPSNIILYDYEKKKRIVEFDGNAEGLFVFNSIHYLENKIWLIPLSANSILYFDKNDMHIRSFDIMDEEETEETMELSLRRIASKFTLLYIWKERYLGVYSHKNKQLIEIDTLEMNYQKVDCAMDEYSLFQMPIQKFHEDRNELMQMIYVAKINNSQRIYGEKRQENVGKRIYTELL